MHEWNSSGSAAGGLRLPDNSSGSAAGGRRLPDNSSGSAAGGRRLPDNSSGSAERDRRSEDNSSASAGGSEGDPAAPAKGGGKLAGTSSDTRGSRVVRLVDETLRDGLQSASVRDPSLEKKIAVLSAMAAIGVDTASVGLPAASARARSDAAALARAIVDQRLGLRPTAAARTVERDVLDVVDASQAAGVSIEVYAFIGSSPIRQYTEDWGMDFLVGCIQKAAETARRAGLPMCLVTEDTTRTPPTSLRTLYEAAIDAGVGRLCLADTVGHADPWGVEALVRYVRDLLASLGAHHVELDWHGHADRGLALANALAAARAGVTGIHGTALGLGERTGNTSIEELVRSLPTGRAVSEDALETYTRVAADALGRPFRGSSPCCGAQRATPEPVIAHTERRAAPAARPLADGPDEPLVAVRMRINDEPVEVAVRPSRTLLELLRYDLDLIGTKQGCDKGDCGACTVLVDGEPALACLTLAAACEGRSVTTVEALEAGARLDPLLDAFDRLGAGQCGFCTPGMLMTAKALLSKGRRPTRDAIRTAISGNLCRCTGYGPIVAAIELAGRIAAGEEPAGTGRAGERDLPAPLPAHDARGGARS